MASNITDAAAAALAGGVDLDLQCGSSSAYTQLGAALSLGLTNQSTIDISTRRVPPSLHKHPDLASGIF